MTLNDPNLVPGTPQASVPPASPAAQGTPHREPDDTEEVYYEGHPLMRGALGKGVLWIFGGLVLIAAAIAGAVMKVHVPWWSYLILVVIALCLIFVPILRTKSIRYRVTNYRIDFERGILSKNIDTLELWHVEDIKFHQSILDRLLGVGDITVVSRDETMPLLQMRAVPHPRPLYEQLKQRVIAVKRSRGVIKMDPG